MNKKVIKIIGIKDKGDSPAYWRSRTPRERIEAVEILREQFIAGTERFQRTIRVIQQT